MRVLGRVYIENISSVLVRGIVVIIQGILVKSKGS